MSVVGLGLRVWSLDRDELLGQSLGGGRHAIRLTFSRDGRHLAGGGNAMPVRLWTVPDFEEIAPIEEPHSGFSTGVAFSPDGRVLATGSWDTTIKLWEFPSRKLLSTLKGHLSHVWDLDISPDGRTQASASSDGTIRLWLLAGDLRPEMASSRTLLGHTGGVSMEPFASGTPKHWILASSRTPIATTSLPWSSHRPTRGWSVATRSGGSTHAAISRPLARSKFGTWRPARPSPACRISPPACAPLPFLREASCWQRVITTEAFGSGTWRIFRRRISVTWARPISRWRTTNPPSVWRNCNSPPTEPGSPSFANSKVRHFWVTETGDTLFTKDTVVTAYPGTGPHAASALQLRVRAGSRVGGPGFGNKHLQPGDRRGRRSLLWKPPNLALTSSSAQSCTPGGSKPEASKAGMGMAAGQLHGQRI
jgi:WD40 repeat protein